VGGVPDVVGDEVGLSEGSVGDANDGVMDKLGAGDGAEDGKYGTCVGGGWGAAVG
jgi:hypothetical protein